MYPYSLTGYTVESFLIYVTEHFDFTSDQFNIVFEENDLHTTCPVVTRFKEVEMAVEGLFLQCSGMTPNPTQI